MTKLSAIANENELDAAMIAQLSRLTGEESAGVGDTLLDTNQIAFRPKVRQAMKTLFTQVSGEIPNLTREEQEAFAEVITILSNFEELMAMLFTGYFTKHIPDQKKYFYLAWLLWAYIRHREDAGRSTRSILLQNVVRGRSRRRHNHVQLHRFLLWRRTAQPRIFSWRLQVLYPFPQTGVRHQQCTDQRREHFGSYA